MNLNDEHFFPPINLAIIGAGHFAHSAHLPALLKLKNLFNIVAIFSRTLNAAEILAQKIPEVNYKSIKLFTNMDELLLDSEVEAVDILLPINLMPEMVEKSLASGKHVISEKPIPPTFAIGKRLCDVYYSKFSERVWMVGENWRYENSFIRAGELVKEGKLGKPISSHWIVHTPIFPGHKYYETDWRRSNTFPGGFVLNVGIHHIAAMRMILGEIVEVSAMAAQNRGDLPPIDTLNACLRFANGTLGVYLISFSAAAPWSQHFHLVGEASSLSVYYQEVNIFQGNSKEIIECESRNNIRQELTAFATAIRTGYPHRNTPDEALRDLAVIEALLDSAHDGTRRVPSLVKEY